MASHSGSVIGANFSKGKLRLFMYYTAVCLVDAFSLQTHDCWFFKTHDTEMLLWRGIQQRSNFRAEVTLLRRGVNCVSGRIFTASQFTHVKNGIWHQLRVRKIASSFFYFRLVAIGCTVAGNGDENEWRKNKISPSVSGRRCSLSYQILCTFFKDDERERSKIVSLCILYMCTYISLHALFTYSTCTYSTKICSKRSS